MNATNFEGINLFVAIFALIVVAVPIAMLLSFWVLRRYRNAVLKSMLEHAGGSGTGSAQPEAGDRGQAEQTSLPDLQLQVVDPHTRLEQTGTADAMLKHADRTRLRVALVYAVAGCVHAVIAAILLFLFNDLEFLPIRTLFTWLILAWPTVPTTVTVAGGNRLLKVIGPLSLVLISLLLITSLDVGELLFLWAYFLGIPTLIMLAVGNRRLRAVGPILLLIVSWVLLGVLSLGLGIQVLPVGLLSTLPLVVILGIALMVLLGFWVVAWLGFRWFAQRYARKKSSDQLSWLATWWLLFTLWECQILSVTGGLLGFLGLLAFVGYEIVLWIGLRPLRAAASRQPPHRLLLLRVFGFRKRSERLLGDLELRWRYLGNIHLIAGTDLATANLEPHEFFEYMNGRLSRQFVKNEEHLSQRIESMDQLPDPDGRFRVNEFFCHDDTWRMTLQRLVSQSEVILMDLRGFSSRNQGVLFELAHLIDVVPVSDIVLVSDGTTDQEFLEAKLSEIWRTMDTRSPNRQRPDVPLRVLRVDRQDSNAVQQLMRLLCNAAQRVAAS
ncbi:MAG: hypothetical protein H8E47_03225 [Anaerolineales bacterium]|nr:hypothetical protein [Anaerolineales bacterium]